VFKKGTRGFKGPSGSPAILTTATLPKLTSTLQYGSIVYNVHRHKHVFCLKWLISIIPDYE